MMSWFDVNDVGVYEVRVGLLAEKAEIVYNPNLTDPNILATHVCDLGFGAELLEHEVPTEHKLDLIVSHTIHYKLVFNLW